MTEKIVEDWFYDVKLNILGAINKKRHLQLSKFSYLRITSSLFLLLRRI